jgi:hypothetical protein
VNQKVAKELGITIPSSVLVREPRRLELAADTEGVAGRGSVA